MRSLPPSKIHAEGMGNQIVYPSSVQPVSTRYRPEIRGAWSIHAIFVLPHGGRANFAGLPVLLLCAAQSSWLLSVRVDLSSQFCTSGGIGEASHAHGTEARI